MDEMSHPRAMANVPPHFLKGGALVVENFFNLLYGWLIFMWLKMKNGCEEKIYSDNVWEKKSLGHFLSSHYFLLAFLSFFMAKWLWKSFHSRCKIVFSFAIFFLQTIKTNINWLDWIDMWEWIAWILLGEISSPLGHGWSRENTPIVGSYKLFRINCIGSSVI